MCKWRVINYKGTIPDDYLNPEPIAAFGDKLKCDLLDVQYGGSDGGPDENGEYLGTNYICLFDYLFISS